MQKDSHGSATPLESFTDEELEIRARKASDLRDQLDNQLAESCPGYQMYAIRQRDVQGVCRVCQGSLQP
jgi:hypothetical protein